MKALIFDLDGTLVDSVYAHVLGWQVAFSEAGLTIEGWRIHRRIGMGGELLAQTVTREAGQRASTEKVRRADKRHSELMHQFLPKPRALPGAVELLKELRRKGISHGIATSSNPSDIKAAVKVLGVARETVIIHKGDTPEAKPEPDLFLECQKRLGVPPHECYAVGEVVWDLLAARRAGMLGIGILSGGYGEDELIAADAYRVFKNAAELHERLDELGLLP